MSMSVRYVALLLFLSAAAAAESEREEAREKWLELARSDLRARFAAAQQVRTQTRKAKNLILFIGDGMGVSTVSAARALKATLHGKLVGQESLSFEQFPFSAFSKTYNADMTVSDSASTATAYWCGIKTRQNLVGVDERVQYQDCASNREESNLKCIGHYAKDAGKAVGIVTTVSVTHASPSPGYAHSASRKWETDGKMEEEDRKAGCKDIALQFVEIGQHVDVLMGAGKDYFENRTDQRNLTDEWLNSRRLKGKKAAYVKSKQQLQQAVDSQATDVLGLFAPSEMLYSAYYRNDSDEPTLTEMVVAALRILKRNPNGFFLFVEGGKIDWGHHNNRAALALHDTIALSDAVDTAQKQAGDDTLIVVTADHSHAFAFGGYPSRNASVLGKNDRVAMDGKPFTYLSYGNGPGHSGFKNVETNERQDLTDVDTTVPHYQQEAAVPLEKDTHGGEDVPIYATGPMAYLFSGTLEQHSIPHFMMHAACIGPKLVGDCATSSATVAVCQKMMLLLVNAIMAIRLAH